MSPELQICFRILDLDLDLKHRELRRSGELIDLPDLSFRLLTVLARHAKPLALPTRPEFSSGPCAKRPGWSAETVVARAFLGRSHRAAGPKAQLKDAIDRTARLLGVQRSIGALRPSNAEAGQRVYFAKL